MRKLLLTLAFIVTVSCSCSVVNTVGDLQRFTNRGGTSRIVIKKEIDLAGKSVLFRKGCSIVFKGGSICNAHIRFNDNTIKGPIRFINCYYEGKIRLNEIDDRDFTSDDEEGTLQFLITNSILNGAKSDFYRDYRIDISSYSSDGFISIKDLDSGADIRFHDNAIYNTTPFKKACIKPVIVLCNVKNVSFTNISFIDVEEHNSHNFKTSSGCTFIQCYGDCSAINLIDCNQKNGDCILRSGLYTHENNHPERTPHEGLSNSKIIVQSMNTGYGLALYCGKNLDLDIEVNNPHRGFYCAGVSNSIINYKGYNPIETKCHILIKDAVCRLSSKGGSDILDMKGCHDLTIKANIDDLLPGETIIAFQSYGSGRKENADFTFRSEKCHHYNIDFTTDIKHFPNNGYFLVCYCAPDSGALDANDIYGCKLSNITIHDVFFQGKAKKYICLVAQSVDADILVNNCGIAANDNKDSEGFNIQVNGNSMGRIRVQNSVLGSVYVKDKESGRFDVEVRDTPIIKGVEYMTGPKSKKGLVRIIQ